jgi:hypothetical protein
MKSYEAGNPGESYYRLPIVGDPFSQAAAMAPFRDWRQVVQEPLAAVHEAVFNMAKQPANRSKTNVSNGSR